MNDLRIYEEMAYKPKNMRSILGVKQERLRGWRAIWDPYLPDRKWPESGIEEIKLRSEYSGRDLLAFRVLMTLIDVKGVDPKKVNRTRRKDLKSLFEFCRRKTVKEIRDSKVAYNSTRETLKITSLDEPYDINDLETVEIPLKLVYSAHLVALDEDTSEDAESNVTYIREELK